WRKEQLERETAALLQRKKAVIAQLNNLKALAGEAESDYPDTDPFAEEAEGKTADDATIVISPKASQAQQNPAASQNTQADQSMADDKETAPLNDPASQRTQVIPAVK
ncbi:adhesin, partial [Xanthomonas citri pv. citri]|nr:adhesin [Xanthomonas citri pv. citri]